MLFLLFSPKADCGLQQHLLLSSDDKMNQGNMLFFFFFFKWIEDYTGFVAIMVSRMPGELQFVNKVASELFIARTILKPKQKTKKHPAPPKAASSLHHLYLCVETRELQFKLWPRMCLLTCSRGRRLVQSQTTTLF